MQSGCTTSSQTTQASVVPGRRSLDGVIAGTAGRASSTNGMSVRWQTPPHASSDNHARDAIKYVVMSYSGPTVRSFQEIAQELTQPPRTTSVEASPWKRRLTRRPPRRLGHSY